MADKRRLKSGLLIFAGVGTLVFVVAFIVSLASDISRRKVDAGKIFPLQLTAAYDAALRGEADHLDANPMFTDEALVEFADIEKEFGAVEDYELDYVEPHVLGVHHIFTVRVKRGGEWMEEIWYATDLGPLTSPSRYDGRFADSIR